jgi:uncharacterized membrane protein YccC
VPRWFGSRTVDEFECVLSVLLAIAFAHLAGAANVSWAAFAGYMVMRGLAAETLVRGLLRIVGTVIGGLLALVVTPLLIPNGLLVTAGLTVVGAASLYAALTARRAYAWLFLGLTFIMVLLDKVEHPAIALDRFVTTRIVETLAGTAACVLVSLLSALTLRRRWPGAPTPLAPVLRWHPIAFQQALQCGVGLAALGLLAARLPVPAVTQAAVTIVAVMMVPVGSIGTSSVRLVSLRLIQRAVGCVAGAAFAALLLYTARGMPALLIAGTGAGVMLGRHLENGHHAHRYAGTQFVIALLLVAVPDSYARVEIAPGIERFMGIMVGMAVLEPVLIAWHLIRRRQVGADGPAASHEPGAV